MTAVVVGAGVGGICAAIRLAAQGHTVEVFERNGVAGGKLATYEREGFTFDIGPSLLTLPQLFDDVLQLAGTRLDAELELLRLDPQFRYRFADGSRVDIADDPTRVAAALDELTPGAGSAWERFLERSGEIWSISERTFLAGPMTSPVDLAARMRSPLDLVRIDGNRTLAAAASAAFDDPRLRQLIGRYATYSGSSPFRAPATLACIPFIEQHHGCWYPLGGLGALLDVLLSAAQRVGVRLHTGREVVEVCQRSGRVEGVRLADGERIAADVVVANVDAAHLYRDLVPRPRQLRRIDRTDPSTSGLIVCVAARGTTPDLAHHNVWFSPDDRAEFAALEAGRLADDVTVYACVSSVTDPTQAPPGDENWFLLINTPPGIGLDRTAATRWALDQLVRRGGPDLVQRAAFTHTIVPSDLAARYRARGGSIYGTSSNGRRAAFARPRNVSPIEGLYLVGGSSHPGGGLPMVTTSARIVADEIGPAPRMPA